MNNYMFELSTADQFFITLLSSLNLHEMKGGNK